MSGASQANQEQLESAIGLPAKAKEDPPHRGRQEAAVRSNRDALDDNGRASEWVRFTTAEAVSVRTDGGEMRRHACRGSHFRHVGSA